MNNNLIKQIVGITLLAVVSLTIFGCSSTGTNFDEKKLSQIKKGETTEQELVQMFGNPHTRATNVTDSKVKSVLTWQYIEANIDGKAFIPIVGGMMSGGHGRAKILTVILNSEGRVDTFSYTGSTNSETGTRLGTQP